MNTYLNNKKISFSFNNKKVKPITLSDKVAEIYEYPVESFSLRTNVMYGKNIEMNVGRTNLIGWDFSPKHATMRDIVWTSSNPSVASVEGGVIKALSAGTTNITATTVDGGISDTFEVTVNDILPNQIYNVNLANYSISSDNTNAVQTTKGINDAIQYAKDNGYKRVKFPIGHYAIDTTTVFKKDIYDLAGNKLDLYGTNLSGVYVPDNIEIDITGSTFKMIDSFNYDYNIFQAVCSHNSAIIGGTIIGDRYTHGCGMRINNEGGELEVGRIDWTTGEPIDDATTNFVRTKDFITQYVDWNTKQASPLPTVDFCIMPLEGTFMNIVDGGKRYIHCYAEDGTYLGETVGGSGFMSYAMLQPNTAKIKISFQNETNLNASYYLNTNLLHYTGEFGFGVNVTNSNNFEINGTTIKECFGDAICTHTKGYNIGYDNRIDNLTVVNCDLSDNRRQGISYVGVGANNLVKNTKIHDIHGVDPQFGIDYEVENTSAPNFCHLNIVEDCHFYNNRKGSINFNRGEGLILRRNILEGRVCNLDGYNLDAYENEFKVGSEIGRELPLAKTFIIWDYYDQFGNDAFCIVKNNKFTGRDLNISKAANYEFTGNECVGTGTTSFGIASSRNSNNLFKNGLFKHGLKCANNTIENCTMTTAYGISTTDKAEINDCIFKETPIYCKNDTTFNKCNVSTTSIKLFNTLWADTGIARFNNCNLDLALNIASNSANNVFFNDCDMSLSRVNTGTVQKMWDFLNCRITFKDTGNLSIFNFVYLNGSESEVKRCLFNGCNISSTYPVRINSSYITNCSTTGQVTLG